MDTESPWRVSPASAADPPPFSTPNPWRTIWFSPRRTVRQLMATEERPSWVLAFALGIIGTVMAGMHRARSLPSATPLALAKASLALVIAQIVRIWLAPLALAWLRNRRMPTTNPRDIREALAWSYVPLAASAVLWVPVFLFTNSKGQPTTAHSLGVLSLEVLRFAAWSVCATWSWVIAVAALKEVQRTSWWGSVGQLVVAYLILLVVHLVIIVLLRQLL